MSTQIHKQTMWAGMTTLSMPCDAKVIAVADQQNMIAIWYETKNPTPYEDRTFEVVGTGMYFNKTRLHKYLGTVLQDEGTLVWHVYEVLQA